MTKERLTQKEYLNEAKKKLGLTWDQFAERANIEPRAFKTYRMPETSKDYRTMRPLVKEAVERLLLETNNRKDK